MRSQVHPIMRGRHHFGKRPQGVARRIRINHRRRKLPRGIQGQPVLGVSRSGPQLTTAFQRRPAAVMQYHDICPTVVEHQRVDMCT